MAKRIKVTKNGEITFNCETDKYEVWDETYTETILETDSEAHAKLALRAYLLFLDTGIQLPELEV